jgi:hypothetical protein
MIAKSPTLTLDWLIERRELQPVSDSSRNSGCYLVTAHLLDLALKILKGNTQGTLTVESEKPAFVGCPSFFLNC